MSAFEWIHRLHPTFRLGHWLLAGVLIFSMPMAKAANFNVTSPGFFYAIDGNSPNPTITLTRGETYTFTVNASISHPFEIVSNPGTGTPYNDGVQNNNITTGIITFNVPQNAPDTLFYICSVHFFGGTINIIGAANMPPQVAITSPTNGASFFGQTSLVVQATATDLDGSVTNVEFFDGATSLGNDTTSPYSITNTFGNGIHILTAVAQDNNGAMTTSAPVMFNIGSANMPPQVAITSPTNGVSFFGQTSLVVQATATDLDGSVTNVEFFDGATSLGNDTTSPYSITNTFGNGTHILTAVAQDNNGAMTTSAPVMFNIGSANMPPQVAITSPTNGASFFGQTSLVVQATATDLDGSVTNVEFFDGATSLGNDTTSPYSITNTFGNGTHVLTAVAQDNNGAMTTSAPVMFNLGDVITNPILERIAKGDITIELQTVADGMAAPVSMASPNDGSGRLWVYDQSGLIWVVTSAGRLATPLLDVRARLNPPAKYDYDERGLLGLAVHPGFATNQLLYTYTSETNGPPADFPAMMDPGTLPNHQSVIAEWRIDPANTNRVDPASRREILRIDKPQSNHNGGTMRFGPDGFLYFTVGDGGQANDVGNGHIPGGNAQSTNMILGKIHRIDVEARSSPNGQYGVPADNPFNGVDSVREIYAYGLRNPFSFSFDRMTGTLWLGDVGQNKVEEIDLIVKGGNYGWNIKEGTNWFDPTSGNVVTAPVRAVPPNLIDPIAVYDHDDGLAVVGGFVYRGTQIPALQGKYVFADWGSFTAPSGRLFYLDAGNVIKELRIGLADRPLGHWVRGFGEGPDGELYVFGSRIIGPAGNTGKMLKLIPGPNPISLAAQRGTNAGEVICGILGGRGPFALQKKSALSAPIWSNAKFSTASNLTVAAEGSAGFLRAADISDQPAIPLSAWLSGLNERPEALTNSATGFGLFSLDGNTLTFNVQYSSLSGVAILAHIHGPASTAIAAPVLIDLAPYNGGAFGSNGTLSGQAILTDAQKAMVLAGQTYVNVHTPDKQGGEVRGQIAPVLMQAALSDANEHPALSTGANGLGLFTLISNQLTFNVTYRGLSGPATMAHIHGPATATQDAGVLVSLEPFNGGSFGSNGTLAGTLTLTPDQLSSVIDGLTYVNFHTLAHNAGEMRGQLVPQSTAVPLTAPLSGLSERPAPITNNAAGTAFFSLEGNALAFSIDYSGLSGVAILSHIHGPATTTNAAPVLVDLAPFNGGAFGTKGTLAGTVFLTPAQRALVLSGQTYVNVHTPDNQSGEIRGQLAPVLMRAYLSGAEERPTPILTPGTALGSFALVLNQLSFAITYRDLPTIATLSHIHGPANVTQAVGVLVDLAPYNGGAFGTAGSLVGAVMLTPAQLAAVVDVMTYVNVHTDPNPGGEIRGQLTR